MKSEIKKKCICRLAFPCTFQSSCHHRHALDYSGIERRGDSLSSPVLPTGEQFLACHFCSVLLPVLVGQGQIGWMRISSRSQDGPSPVPTTSLPTTHAVERGSNVENPGTVGRQRSSLSSRKISTFRKWSRPRNSPLLLNRDEAELASGTSWKAGCAGVHGYVRVT